MQNARFADWMGVKAGKFLITKGFVRSSGMPWGRL
jgi:hypothetical protein